MVECDKCGKQMTKTTLRYHHDKNCPGEKINKESLPVKKRVVKQPQSKIGGYLEKTPLLGRAPETTTYKDILNDKLKLKRESISKLASQIA